MSDADLSRSQAGDDPAAAAFDLAAVQHDNALIDALATGNVARVDSPEEAELAALLASWRAEILAPPMPAEPTLDQVVAAVDSQISGSAHGRGGLRLLRPIAGAAAAVAVVMAGLTVFSYNAVPGDPLWKVKEVVFTERANSTVASIDTATNLEEAERLLQSGDPAAAAAKLQSAVKRVTDVNEPDKRAALNARLDQLMADAAKGAPPAAGMTTTPGAPSPSAISTAPPMTPIATVTGAPVTTVPQVPSQLPVIPPSPSATTAPTMPPASSTPPSPSPSPTTSPASQPTTTPATTTPSPEPGTGDGTVEPTDLSPVVPG
ncbi:anti-sigma-D factor RsdA [Rhodococcus kronopolitis]|uniref:Anti-sigma-D factor RsdA n=1 Tax=Rhodococcus kronopolitis TaxID=1460226 RepID=A0ABV9FKS3_9NOCA